MMNCSVYKAPVSLSYKELILSHNPISYWRLGEASGTVATDEKAVNNGSYAGGHTKGAPGAIAGNTAISFNGTTGYVLIPDASSLKINGDLTLALWVKVSNNGAFCGLLSKGSNNEYELSADFRGSLGTNILGWRGGGNISVDNFFTGFLGSWVHVAATVSGNALTVYRNGTPLVSAALGARAVSTNNVNFASRAGAAFFAQALLDEVAIYNRALTAQEIASHYSAASQ